MSNRMAAFAAGLLAVAVANQASFAAPVPWTTPAGSTSKVTYSDGQSDKGLFGNPTLTGGTFAFLSPSDFTADAANGSAESTTDKVSFKVTTTTGDLAKINIQEYGDWSILGGSAITKAAGGLTVTRLDTGHFGVTYTLTPKVKYTNVETGDTYYSPDTPTMPGSGNWRADYSLSLPTGTRTVSVALTNLLQAASSAGSTSSIYKSSIAITAVTATAPAVPEPASLGLLTLAGTALVRRRRTV